MIKAVQVLPPRDNRLTLAFNDRIASFHVAFGATYGEVAWRLRSLSPHRYGVPVSITIILASDRQL